MKLNLKEREEEFANQAKLDILILVALLLTLLTLLLVSLNHLIREINKNVEGSTDYYSDSSKYEDSSDVELNPEMFDAHHEELQFGRYRKNVEFETYISFQRRELAFTTYC